MFRTRSGQTGHDAYVNEAAAIANEQRELDARMARLAAAIVEENDTGELFGYVALRPFVSMAGGISTGPHVRPQDLVVQTAGRCYSHAGSAARLRDMLLSTPDRPVVR